MPLFKICTFVNDEALYAGMRESFQAAGFVSPLASFAVQVGDPYRTIDELGQAEERYVILVHQDVRCDQGETADTLSCRLDELTQLDPDWAVAGNAGGTTDHRLVVHVSDPHEFPWRPAEELPLRVQTLDENFLVLRTAKRPSCSPRLSGFHLYGADVCLRAAESGCSAYVVDFRLSHLSPGAREGLEQSARAFARAWAGPVPRYLRTSTGFIALARPQPLSRLMEHPRVRWRFHAE